MKKLVLGFCLAFGLVQGNCRGMDRTIVFNDSELSGLVQSVVLDPSESDDLRDLISYLTDSVNGREACNNVIDVLSSITLDSLGSKRVCAMLCTVRDDWDRYGYTLSVDYYIKEGFAGRFGPYFVPDDVEY